jgi:HK97 family phage major capsid protein
MELKKLLEERAAVGNEMNQLAQAAISDNHRPMKAEELERFDKMDADFRSLSEKIETAKRIERSQELTASKETSKAAVTSHRPQQITRKDDSLAFAAWAMSAAGYGGHVMQRHNEAAAKCGTSLANKNYTLGLAEDVRDVEITRNQSSQINSEGGYLQSSGLFQGFERNLKWFGNLRSFCKVVRTPTAEPYEVGYGDDTGNQGYWSGQNQTPTNTNIIYAKKFIGEYTARTEVFPVSLQALDDARINLAEDVGEVLGQRLGRLTNAAYTNGVNGGPRGFMADASAGATAAGATIAYSDLVNLLFSVDKAYRDDPSFRFVMHDSTLQALWLVSDQDSRPIFWNQMMNLASDMPLTILGKPIAINNDMPQVATGKKPIAALIGSKFVIRDVKDVQILTLDQRYLDQLAVGFIAYLRTDAKLINSNCCKVLTMP